MTDIGLVSKARIAECQYFLTRATVPAHVEQLSAYLSDITANPEKWDTAQGTNVSEYHRFIDEVFAAVGGAE